MTFSDAERAHLADPKALLPHDDEPDQHEQEEERIHRDRWRSEQATKIGVLANPHAGVRSEA